MNIPEDILCLRCSICLELVVTSVIASHKCMVQYTNGNPSIFVSLQHHIFYPIDKEGKVYYVKEKELDKKCICKCKLTENVKVALNENPPMLQLIAKRKMMFENPKLCIADKNINDDSTEDPSNNIILDNKTTIDDACNNNSDKVLREETEEELNIIIYIRLNQQKDIYFINIKCENVAHHNYLLNDDLAMDKAVLLITKEYLLSKFFSVHDGGKLKSIQRGFTEEQLKQDPHTFYIDDDTDDKKDQDKIEESKDDEESAQSVDNNLVEEMLQSSQDFSSKGMSHLETKFLLDKYHEFSKKCGPGKQFKYKKQVFDKIADLMSEKYNRKFTSTQVKCRHTTVVSSYKKFIDNKSKTGTAKINFEFEDEFKNAKADDDSIQPELGRTAKGVKFYKKDDVKEKINEGNILKSVDTNSSPEKKRNIEEEEQRTKKKSRASRTTLFESMKEFQIQQMETKERYRQIRDQENREFLLKLAEVLKK